MVPTEIQRILVPTDLSDFSKSAAGWAATFHRHLGSHITLLFADEPYVPFDVLEGPAAYFLQKQPEFREGMKRELMRFTAECFPDDAPSVDTLVVESDPAHAIVTTARKIDADLILMGTHGRRGWERALLGSVTEKVLRSTERRLMSVPSSFSRPAGPIRKILCPVNFTTIGRQALDEAVALAETFGSNLMIVHVADDSADAPPAQEFAAWVEPGVRERCSYSTIFARGHAAEQVLQIANQSNVDLLVIGAEHKRFADTTVIGSTSEKVVRFARQPVWTVVSRRVAAKPEARPEVAATNQ